MCRLDCMRFTNSSGDAKQSLEGHRGRYDAVRHPYLTITLLVPVLGLGKGPCPPKPWYAKMVIPWGYLSQGTFCIIQVEFPGNFLGGFLCTAYTNIVVAYLEGMKPIMTSFDRLFTPERLPSIQKFTHHSYAFPTLSSTSNWRWKFELQVHASIPFYY